MSGIYIPGMEMPGSCASCKIKRRNGKKMICPLCGEEWDIHDPMSADHTLDDCPLVPVPPHGRLGDMDAIARKIRRFGDYVDFTKDEIAGWFENGDFETIIPAEEVET